MRGGPHRQGRAATLAGKATSDASGDWTLQLTGDAQPGDYYAIAAKKVLRKNAHHTHICKAGKSSSVTVNGRCTSIWVVSTTWNGAWNGSW